jgi:DNA-binding MarR family transcriptional regulator
VPTATDLATVGRLRLAVLRLSRRIRQHADTGVTPSQFSALSTIRRHGPLRLGELADRERIRKSSVTRLVAKLQADGYAECLPDPDDGRSSRVSLTADGRQLLDDSAQRAEAYLARQFATLTPDEQRRLAAALPALERLLDVHT